MSSHSSASNNRTEFIYQRNNGSGNGWEVSEAPSCEDLVVNLEFPGQNFMDCNKKCVNDNSSSTQEDESHPPVNNHLCEFHRRFARQFSPRRSHHGSKSSTKSDRKCNQDHAGNCACQLERTPISCRANSYSERISKSTYQDRLKHTAKCSVSSKDVEGVELKRNTGRTARSLYNRQPIEVRLENVRGDTNEGYCTHSSPNGRNPHFCLTPPSTDSAPEPYEQKSSKKFSETNASPPRNESAAQLPSSSFKKEKNLEPHVSQEYSSTKAKQSCLEPYTTTEFFTKSCDSTTVQILQGCPLNRNLKSSMINEMDAYKLQSITDADKPCSSCTRRSNKKDSFLGALKESWRNLGEDMTMRRCSCNKSNIAKCMSAKEMSSQTRSHSPPRPCCASKCTNQSPLKIPSSYKATNSICSRENAQLKKQASTRDCVPSDYNENVPKISTCSMQRLKRSLTPEGNKPIDSKDISLLSRLKFPDSVEKMQAEKLKQSVLSPMAIAKKSCEEMALTLTRADTYTFFGPRCLLGVSLDRAILDLLSCFKSPIKACKASRSKNSQIKMRLFAWLNAEYASLGRDINEMKSKPTCSEGSLSPDCIKERKKILDSLCAILEVHSNCFCSCKYSKEQLMKKLDEACKQCAGSKVEEYLRADLEGASETTVNKIDVNPNYTDSFLYRECDNCCEKYTVSEPITFSKNACPFSCCTKESWSDLFKVNQNSLQLLADLKQAERLCTPDTETSSGSHYETAPPCSCPDLERTTFNGTQFAKSTARSYSSNASTTSESSENNINSLMRKITKFSKKLFPGNDALSRITERSSEMRSTDEDFRKSRRLCKSSVSFKDDIPCQDSDQELSYPGTSRNLETNICSRPTTPRSILRHCKPEETIEDCADSEWFSRMDESCAVPSIRTYRQSNITCSPEKECKSARSFIEERTDSFQTCAKPKYCLWKHSHGAEQINKDDINILKKEIIARRSKGAPTGVEIQSNELKRKSCPIHAPQIDSSSLQFKTLVQKSGCPCFKKQLLRSHDHIPQNTLVSSQNLPNRDTLIKAKSEYLKTSCLGKSIPNEQSLSKPSVLSSTEVKSCPARMTQFQMISPVTYSKCEQLTEPAFTIGRNSKLCSRERTRNDTNIYTEDRSSSGSPSLCESCIDPKHQIELTVKLKEPFELSYINYSKIIQPKTRELPNEPCSSKCFSPCSKWKKSKSSTKHPSKGELHNDQDQEKYQSSSALDKSNQCGSLEFNSSVASTSERTPLPDQRSKSVPRSCRSICHSLHKSFTDHQDEEKYQGGAALDKSIQCESLEFRASAASTSEKSPLFDQRESVPRSGSSMYHSLQKSFTDDQDEEKEQGGAALDKSIQCESLEFRASAASTSEKSPFFDQRESIPRSGSSMYHSLQKGFTDDQDDAALDKSIQCESLEFRASAASTSEKSPLFDQRESVPRSGSSKYHSFHKSFTDDQDQEKYQGGAALDKSIQCESLEFRTSESYTPDKTNLFYQNYESPYLTTQRQPAAIETSHSILSFAGGSSYKDIVEDFPVDPDDDQPHESFYINSKEELSFPDPNSRAREALPSPISYNSTETGKREDDAGTSLQYRVINEPITLAATSAFQNTSHCCNLDPYEELAAATLEKISEEEITQKESVDNMVHADQDLETANKEYITSARMKPSESRIYDMCSQQCPKMKTEPKTKQNCDECGMPDNCQNSCPCELLEPDIPPFVECDINEPQDCCCELHHRDESMCIYIDLCKCRNGKGNIGLYKAPKLRTFPCNNATRPHSTGFGRPSCVGSRPEEANHLGPVCRESNHPPRVYRALSTQTGNENENHKRSIPKKIMWAVAKISVYDDNSKTYELMQVQPKLLSPNSENVVIVVPKN